MPGSELQILVEMKETLGLSYLLVKAEGEN
jgi:hypothetical protein